MDVDLGSEALETLNGTVELLTFRNEETGFSVLDFVSGDELVTVVGVLPHVSPGEALRLRGKWGNHATFGRQFAVQYCEREMPSTQAEVLKYLSSGVIKGVRAGLARRIVEAFGEDTLAVLQQNPRRLLRIKGITKEKAEHIGEQFNEQFALRQTMIALERLGLATAECLRAYKALGVRAGELVQQNPFVLCESGMGFPFARADAIAQNVQPLLGHLRQEAALLHVLRQQCYQNGHTCLPQEQLPVLAAALLACHPSELQASLNTLCENKRLLVHVFGNTSVVFLPAMYKAEKNCAERIGQLLRFPPAATNWQGDFDALLTRMEDSYGLHYDSLQRAAIRGAMERGLLLLTGGPGTGKTTTLKGILHLFSEAGLKVALAAPTGRAAKRMSELSGAPAKTIHRLLEVEWGEDERQRFARGRQNPLAANAVIIDEISMVDVPLFSALLDALPIGCRLVLVGDADQLPPVGAGNVLQNLLQAEALPTVRLTKIFRQAQQSLIVTNAHAIVQGDLPQLDAKDRDFFFIERNSPAAAAQTIAELVSTRLPRAYSYDSLQDIQVLCPSRKGECGSQQLNARLQAVLNTTSGRKEQKIGARVFKQGDKVMQMKNNYNLLWQRPASDAPGMGVFNGDIGHIAQVDPIEGIFKLQFDDERLCDYPFDAAAEELEHAYAITVHKSQGNEFPCVVLPVVGVPDMLRYRNLLYTAVTRARQRIVLVGSRWELARMVENTQKTKRYAALAAFLSQNPTTEVPL